MHWKEGRVSARALEGGERLCACIGRRRECVRVHWKEGRVCEGGRDGGASGHACKRRRVAWGRVHEHEGRVRARAEQGSQRDRGHVQRGTGDV